MQFQKIHVAHFLDNLPTPAALFDTKMHYILVTRRWLDTLKIEGCVLGRSHYEIFPNISKYWKEIHQRALAGETIHGDNDLFDRSNGRIIWLRWEIAPWHASDGSIGGVIIWGEDITKLKEADGNLDTMQQRLSAIMNAAPVGIAYSHDTTCEQITGNPALRRLFEMTPGENLSASCPDPNALGRRITYFQAGKIVDVAELPLQQAVAEGREMPPIELEVVMPDGRRWDSLVSGAPVKDEGNKIIGGVSVIVDITERRKLEEALRDSDRRKNEFLAMLGHEIRNPLSPIAHGVHILQSKAIEQNDQKLLSMMQRQLSHLTRLIDDLLEVSRINQGKIELNKTYIELSDIISDAVEACSKVIADAEHKLTVSAPSTSLKIFADETRLTQVINNLLVNAAKFTEHGGHIELSAKQDGDFAVVIVRDNGSGIHPEKLDEVFDLFAQEKRDGSRQGGLGIGLALARMLVMMHDGTIVARSDGDGCGSEFEVRLPLAVA